MGVTVAVAWFPRATGTDGPVHLSAARPTAADLLRVLDVPPDTALVVRAGTPIPLDAALAEGDALRVVRTISGGNQ